MEEDTEANTIQVSQKDEAKARIEVDAKDRAGLLQKSTLVWIPKSIRQGGTLSISSVEHRR